jgi:hypothetical protein
MHSGFILKYCSRKVKKIAGFLQKSGRVSCGFDERGRKKQRLTGKAVRRCNDFSDRLST